MRLGETVVDHIDRISTIAEEGADLFGANANLLVVRTGWFFGIVSGEHLLWRVHVFAEMEIIDFFGVTTVTVTASD